MSQVSKQGYLEKRGSVNRGTWKTRYYVLAGTVLLRFDKKPVGTFLLLGFVCRLLLFVVVVVVVVVCCCLLLLLLLLFIIVVVCCLLFVVCCSLL